MVKINISTLMGKNKLTQKAFSELTQINSARVRQMYYEEVKTFELKELDIICKTFHCPISAILEFVPDN